MTGAVVVLAVAVVVLSLALAGSEVQARRDRQAFAEERRVLVDRVIAKHTGEVIALDKASAPRESRESTPPPHIVGLS